MKKSIFSLIAIIGVFCELVLFGIATETWDGACSHKVEYGLIPFYRVAHEGVTSGICSTGILSFGVLATALLAVFILVVIYFAWVKLVKNG